MCGRYTLADPARAFQELFGLEAPPSFPARFNIAPGQDPPVARGSGPEIVSLRWGLVPRWSRDPASGPRPINARIETAPEKPMFREAIARRRCVVPADGFYEWQTGPEGKRPWLFRLAGARPMALAGLWERWDGPGGPMETFAILTTRPNELVAPIHGRMPVIVPPDRLGRWLEPGPLDPSDLEALATPWPGESMEAFPVSRAVNDPRNDGPELLQPRPR